MKLPREAIWLILLAAVLLLLISKMHGETPQHYQKRVARHIASAQHMASEWDRLPHGGDSLDRTSGAIWITTVEIDIELCRIGLYHYQRFAIPKAEMERLMKQLDRDMEDYPPQVAGK